MDKRRPKYQLVLLKLFNFVISNLIIPANNFVTMHPPPKYPLLLSMALKRWSGLGQVQWCMVTMAFIQIGARWRLPI